MKEISPNLNLIFISRISALKSLKFAKINIIFTVFLSLPKVVAFWYNKIIFYNKNLNFTLLTVFFNQQVNLVIP